MARDRDDRDDRDEEDRPRRRSRRDDDYEDDGPLPTGSPGGAKAAGIIWVCTGAIAALLTLFGLYQVTVVAGLGGPPAQLVCGTLFWAFVALVFLMVGIKTLNATSAEPLANGIGSIILGLIIGGLGGLLAVGSVIEAARFGPLGQYLMVVAVVLILYGVALIVAGILIIVARDEYNRYRRYRKALQREADDRAVRRSRDDEDDRPRRRPARDEQDGEDDRPRRRRDERD
jgi:hypothetical protein